VVGKSDKLLCTVEDVSGDFSGGPEGAPDGFLDQVCKFVTIDLGAKAGDTEATIHCSAPEVIEGIDCFAPGRDGVTLPLMTAAGAMGRAARKAGEKVAKCKNICTPVAFRNQTP